MAALTKDEVFAIIDKRIKQEMARKNEYIEKNGFKNIATIRAFDSAIATLDSLYSTFEREFFERRDQQ